MLGRQQRSLASAHSWVGAPLRRRADGGQAVDTRGLDTLTEGMTLAALGQGQRSCVLRASACSG